MAHRSGFVNIIGNPNVGKSTLMNALVGEKLSIITSKAQTTRHRIMGIVNGEDFQIVYSDTPGVLKPQYKLQEAMMGFVRTALIDADVVLFVTDIFEDEFQNEEIFEKVRSLTVPVLVLVNKVDQGNEEKVNAKLELWKQKLPQCEVIPISALLKFNTEKVLQMIVDNLPEGEPYYPKDQLTDKPERFFVSEIIREKIFVNYKKEIPYSCEVAVNSFKEDDDIIRINAEIYVTRESQKGIIIGHKGEAIKRVGIQARKNMEDFFEKQVHLELFVKVKKDWKDDDRMLKHFGYEN
jgi:GTPase